MGIPHEVRSAWLALVIFLPPLLVGAVHPGTILGMSVVGLVGLVGMARHARATKRRLELHWFAALTLALVLVTGLQLVPLPMWLLGLLAGTTRDMYDFVFKGLPHRAGWAPVSVHPSAKALELGKLAGLALGVLAAANTHRKASSRQALAFQVTLVGGVVAILALVGLAVESGSFFGLYEPETPWDHHVAHGPFVNPNHLAGFLGMTALVAFGAAATRYQPRGRGAFALVLGGLCVAGVVLSGSRGGVAALAVALPVFLWLMRRVARDRSPLLKSGLVILAVVGVVVMASRGHMWQTQRLTDDQKIQAWGAVLTQILDNPLVGTGRGAFPWAHTRYKTLPVNLRFTHAENEVLQAMADWGVPIGVGVTIGALALMWTLLRRKDMDTVDAGVTAGLLFLGLHNLVDFNLEILGVAMPAAVLLGSQLGRLGGRGSGRSDSLSGWLGRTGERLRATTVLPILMGVGVVVGALLHHLWDPGGEISSIRSLAPSVGPDRVEEAMADALELAPAEYLVPMLGAKVALPLTLAEGFEPARVMSWVNKAAYLDPTAPGVHILAARLLMSTGHRGQGVLEYRLAITYGANPSPIYRELMRFGPSRDEILSAIPEGDRQAMRVMAGVLEAASRWEEADAVYGRLMDAGGFSWAPALRRARISLEHGTTEQALERCRHVVERAPNRAEGHRLYGEALAKAGRDGAAMEQWFEATRLDPTDDRSWARLFKELARRGRWTELARELVRFRPHSRNSPRARALYLTWMGEVAAKEGMLAKAAGYYKEACDVFPKSASLPEKLARLRKRLGDVAGAREALLMALERGGDRGRLRKELEALSSNGGEAAPDVHGEVR